MRLLPDIKTAVGRFLSTKADIFLRGGWSEYQEFSVSFVARTPPLLMG